MAHQEAPAPARPASKALRWQGRNPAHGREGRVAPHAAGAAGAHPAAAGSADASTVPVHGHIMHAWSSRRRSDRASKRAPHSLAPSTPTDSPCILGGRARLELPAQLQRGERVQALAGQRRDRRHARAHQLRHHARNRSLQLRRRRTSPTMRCLPCAVRRLRAHGAARLAGSVGGGRPADGRGSVQGEPAAGEAAPHWPSGLRGRQDRRKHGGRARRGTAQQRVPVCGPRRAAHARMHARGATPAACSRPVRRGALLRAAAAAAAASSQLATSARVTWTRQPHASPPQGAPPSDARAAASPAPAARPLRPSSSAQRAPAWRSQAAASRPRPPVPPGRARVPVSGAALRTRARSSRGACQLAQGRPRRPALQIGLHQTALCGERLSPSAYFPRFASLHLPSRAHASGARHAARGRFRQEGIAAAPVTRKPCCATPTRASPRAPRRPRYSMSGQHATPPRSAVPLAPSRAWSAPAGASAACSHTPDGRPRRCALGAGPRSPRRSRRARLSASAGAARSAGSSYGRQASTPSAAAAPTPAPAPAAGAGARPAARAPADSSASMAGRARAASAAPPGAPAWARRARSAPTSVAAAAVASRQARRRPGSAPAPAPALLSLCSPARAQARGVRVPADERV